MRPATAHVHRRWLIVVAITVMLTVTGSAAGWADAPGSDRAGSSATRGGGGGADSAKQRGPAHGKQRGPGKSRNAKKKQVATASSSRGGPRARSGGGSPASTASAPKAKGNAKRKGEAKGNAKAAGSGKPKAKGDAKGKSKDSSPARSMGSLRAPRTSDRGPLAAQGGGSRALSDATRTTAPVGRGIAGATTSSGDAAAGTGAEPDGPPTFRARGDAPGVAERWLGSLPAAVDRATRTVLRDATVASRSFDMPTILLLALLGYLLVQRWLDRGPLPMAGAPATGEPDDDDAHIL